MNRRNFVLGAGTATFASMLRTPSGAVVANRRLSCGAFFDRIEIGLDTEFSLTVLLKSLQNGTRLFVPLTWGYRGFQISVVDEAGQKIDPPINDFHPRPPAAFGDLENFVSMYLDMLVGETRTFAAREFFLKTGTFSVQIGYLSPAMATFTTVPDVVLTEDGFVDAQPIEVRVF